MTNKLILTVVTTGGQVSNKNFSIDIEFYMKKSRKKSRLHA